MTYTTIAQTQVHPATPATPPLMEGGILAAIAIYVIKESISFFKHKDANEDRLIATLIEDLRLERSNEHKQQGEMLMQLKASHDKIVIAIEKMSVAYCDINTALQQSKRTETEIFHALRENHQCLILMNEKLNRLLPGGTDGKQTQS